MKKYICIVLCLLMIMTSCQKEGKEESSKPNIDEYKYKNGNYSAQWSDYVDGWIEFLNLTIENDIITIVQYDARDNNGTFLSTIDKYDEDYAINNKSFGLPIIKNSEKFNKIIDEYNNSDKNVDNMECIAGATRSTNRFKLMVDTIMKNNAIIGSTQDTVYIQAYEDGIYKVEESQYNDGWKDFVEITVTNGLPVVTTYDSISPKGKLKSQDDDMKTRMASYNKAKKKGEIYPEVYMTELKNQFSQYYKNIDDIEGVSGATISSSIFKKLTKKALYNSSVRGKNNDKISKYKDGTYSAEMSEFEDGWKDFITLEIKNDTIHITKFDSIDVSGKFKSENEEQKKAMMNGNVIKNLPETYPQKCYKDIVARFSQSNFEILDMENVSGATLSSNNFKLMMGQILRTTALKGESKKIIVEPYHIQ